MEEKQIMEWELTDIIKDLSSLYLSVKVMTASLEMECIEPQVLACLETISLSLKAIENKASNLKEYEDIKKA